jgi:hypothetical protein
MPTVKMTHLCAGLVVSAIGLVVFLSSPANAERVSKKQGSYQSQRVASNTNARGAKARDVREPNAADPDPFIRSQILRDASGFFGGLD